MYDIIKRIVINLHFVCQARVKMYACRRLEMLGKDSVLAHFFNSGIEHLQSTVLCTDSVFITSDQLRILTGWVDGFLLVKSINAPTDINATLLLVKNCVKTTVS